MKLTLAVPDHAQTIADFYQSLHDDSFPHPEMFDADVIAQLLADQELSVVIASRGGNVLGCGIGFPQVWNQSFEIGALSVDSVDERSQVGRALFEALRRLGIKTYGVAYFRANSESSFKRGREIGATCWGLRIPPGARSYSEAEMLMGFFENRADAMRIHPPENDVTSMPFVARIVNSLEGSETDVPYPKNFPVGSPRGTGSPVISGQVWPTYHSVGNYISIESTAGPYPIEIIREFVGKVRAKGVADVRLHMPANQSAAFIDLVEFGFTPIAYIPGWYLRGPHRFDCISMISGLPRASRSDDTFIGRASRKILDGLRVSG